ncbi:MAG: type II secretion system GspH family protein [Sulfuricaulis sp.]|nr:type II secretion system GspH family protein [Sulfuricaulis sp.]
MNSGKPAVGMRGVTLVELIVAIVIIGVALAGVLMVFVRNTGASADPVITHQSLAIAEAYLEEILAKRFAVPVAGPEGGESRANYDEVDDYHNLANNGCLTVVQGYSATAACPAPGSCICDQSGQPIDGLQNYVATVQVLARALTVVTASNAERVEVTVTSPFGGSVLISGYRTNY